MKVKTLKPFKIRDNIIVPGTILEVSVDNVATLGGLIMPVLLEVQSKQKSWLTDNNELRTNGYVEDLAAEIIKLTEKNLSLQRKLLIRHCEAYDQHHLPHLWELWEERVAIMENDGGLNREEAEYNAAQHLNIQAFLLSRVNGEVHAMG